MSADPVRTARSRKANAVRRGDPPAVIAEATRELNAAHVERSIQRALSAAPPLSASQRERLAQLLTGGAR